MPEPAARPRSMADTNRQAAIAEALQRLKKATDRHKAAMKQLDD